MSFTPGETWSHSGARLVHDCLRSHYYQVYGSWGGWGRHGSESAKTLYRLKQGYPLLAYVGVEVHGAAAKTLRFVRAGRKLADTDAMVDRIEERIRHGIDYSARGLWSEARSLKKATCILSEHLEGEDLLQSTIDDAVLRARTTMRNFLEIWLPQLQEVPVDQWVMIDSLDSISYRGFQLYMAPDFLASDDESSIVYDWKTGVGGDIGQLMVYGVYRLAKVLGRMPRPEDANSHLIRGRSVPLLREDGSTEDLDRLLPEHVELVLADIDTDIDRMAPLVRPGARFDRAPFPKTEHRGQCEQCRFFSHCETES